MPDESTTGRARGALALVWRALFAGLAFAAVFPPLYGSVVPEERDGATLLERVPPGAYRVLVVDWGYHTAIVVEQPRGLSLGPPGEERAPFLEYAWGDRRFFMESDYRPHALFATLALPTASVLYLDGRADLSSLSGARAVYARTVDDAALQLLLRDLERSFAHAADGTRLAPFAPAPGYRGRFFPARGRYLWSRDCNWWTVRRLAGAALAGSGTGVVFSAQVAGRLKGFRRAGGAAASRWHRG